MGLRYPPKRASISLPKPNRQYLSLLGEYLRIFFFRLKGGRVNFWMKMLIPRTHFLKILTPFLGSIYIATLIFTRNRIISVKLNFHYALVQTSIFLRDAGHCPQVISILAGDFVENKVFFEVFI
jgi:hypothetical protein